MKDARFTIPTSALLPKVVDLLDKVPMEQRGTKGDVYEYMLGKIATAGQNGQFRAPRHIIRLMVELTEPHPADVVCDPACGKAGFLVATGPAALTQAPGGAVYAPGGRERGLRGYRATRRNMLLRFSMEPSAKMGAYA